MSKGRPLGSLLAISTCCDASTSYPSGITLASVMVVARALSLSISWVSQAIRLAIEHSGITQARVAVELGRVAFANMMDYMKIDPLTGDPSLDWSGLTREQAAAMIEITVDDYIDGRGANARDVRKVKFKLGDKRAALMDIAKLFGWIVEKRENKVVDEFDTMSDEQIEAWLDERARARVKMRHRASAEAQRHGIRTPRRRHGAGLINIPMVGTGADGQRPKWGDGFLPGALPHTGHLVRELGDGQPTMTDRVAARVPRIGSARAPSTPERK
jgi:phage terminase small subunit